MKPRPAPRYIDRNLLNQTSPDEHFHKIGFRSQERRDQLQRAIVDGLEDVKAQDIQVFNTEHLSPLFERVIVASGASNRQTKALASSVRDAVKKAGFAVPRHEGEENGEWIIVDCGQCVVHIMQPTIRQYYRLEEIWGDKPVRLKLGGAKPAKIFASEDASAAAKPPEACSQEICGGSRWQNRGEEGSCQSLQPPRQRRTNLQSKKLRLKSLQPRRPQR